MEVSPRRVPGCWDDGFALDLHTRGSDFLGYDEYGHAQFDTTRTELGELLYKLKYKGDLSAIAPIARAVADFVASWNPGVDVIVPAPPSRRRPVQPLFQIADEVGGLLGLPVDKQSARKTEETPELKNVFDYAKRLELLADAHSVDSDALRNRRILLLDDLYRSGATLNAVARALRDEGGASAVFVLTVTKTRSSS
jgi:predicted amidophosphoribosyltransferase